MLIDRSLTAGALLLCGACQAYTPVSVAPGNDGQNVRVTLTSSAVTAPHGAFGSGVGQLEGDLRDVTDSTISLSVTSVLRAAGSDEAWNGERITLPRTDIALVERRKTTVARSFLAAGAVLGTVVLIGRSINGGDASGGVGRSSPPVRK